MACERGWYARRARVDGAVLLLYVGAINRRCLCLCVYLCGVTDVCGVPSRLCMIVTTPTPPTRQPTAGHSFLDSLHACILRLGDIMGWGGSVRVREVEALCVYNNNSTVDM